MASTVRTPAANPPAKGIPMSPTRKTALVAGIFYLITFISIPTLALYGPVKNHRDWILGSGGHTAVLVGGFALAPNIPVDPVCPGRLGLQHRLGCG
jgi:hypothetical protein